MPTGFNYKFGITGVKNDMNKLNFNERLDDFWVYPKLTKARHIRDYKDNFFEFLNDDSKNEKAATNLYIHIPFCDSSCIFCPYYKLYGKNNYKNNLTKYVDALIKEMQHYSRTTYFIGRKIHSVHFGGGNPFLLPIDELSRIVQAARMFFDIDVNDNWAMEGSINSIKHTAYVEGLLNLGINRISFGVQTFNPDIRKKMNIRTQLKDIYRGVDILKNGGLTDFCIDLMYNMPDQTTADFINDLKIMADLDPYHVDIYNMAVFPNTYLYDLINEKKEFKINPSNKNQCDMFKKGDEWLKSNGFRQIITNTYSRRQQDVHIGDKLYLNNCNVLGIGASSRGYINGYAYKNVCEIQDYIDQVENGNYPANLAAKYSIEQHNDRKMVFFPILMKINKVDIPDIDRYKEHIDYIIDEGLAEWNGNTLLLTQKGVFWSGNISTLFFDQENWKMYMQSFLHASREKVNPYNEDKMGNERIKLEDWEDDSL